MKLSDYIIDFLVNEGVTHIFELTGGAITHILDSASRREDIQCVSVHHEQAGAFAAEGYARMNSNLGVAMATSGPGALNMVTGKRKQISILLLILILKSYLSYLMDTYSTNSLSFDQRLREILILAE
jgi:glyoxylate carboligase